jgi:predicted nucleic acid-binding protein
MGFLIDTCIWIDAERGLVSPLDVSFYTQSEPVYISPVTIAELSFGIEMSKDESIRQKRLIALNRLKRKPILYIDELTGEVFGRIASLLYKQGRGADFRVQDIWLSSQAIQNGLKLLTRNVKDFADIPGLDLVIYKQEEIKY